MPRLSHKRTIIGDYWYTDAQMEDVGSAWAGAAINRLFICPHVSYKTGIERNHLQSISSFPYNIILPFNKGNFHWTAITVAIEDTNGKKTVKINFTDSQFDMQNYTLPFVIQKEMDRIEKLFCQFYGADNVIVYKDVYKYSWRQSDGSSCGPYALKNAERCLAGKEEEINPGREVIRREQLDLMVHETAIKGCSTNNEVDEILVHWLIQCISNEENFAIDNGSDVERACKEYALFKKIPLECVRNKFIEEFNLSDSHLIFIARELADSTGRHVDEITRELKANYSLDETKPIRHRPVSLRIRELLQENVILRKTVSIQQYDEQICMLREENTLEKIELIRLVIANAQTELDSYQETADIIVMIAQQNIFDAVEKLRKLVTKKEDVESCFVAIGEIIGLRKIVPAYPRILSFLADSYRGVHNISQAIKTLSAESSLLHRRRNQGTFFQTPIVEDDSQNELEDRSIEELEAIKILLQAAIRRNSASILMKVVYLINDFFSSLAEILTLGSWVPEYKQIELIKRDLEIDGASSNKEIIEIYEQELGACDLLLDRKYNEETLDVMITR